MSVEGVERAWREQSAWSQVANKLKRGVERWKAAALLCTFVGATCAAGSITFGLSSNPGKFLAFCSAVSVGAAGVAYARTGPESVGQWLSVRSISEALKSEVFRFLAGQGTEDFDERISELDANARPLWRYRLSTQPARRALPEVNDIASYLAVRVDGQIEQYYRPEAARLKLRLARLRRAELALMVSSVVLAAVAGTWEVDRAALWVPVITTLTAAVSGHAANGRYDFLLTEYLQTAAELELIRERLGPYIRMTDAELVEMAEHVISIQNEGWMAKLTPTEGSPPSA